VDVDQIFTEWKRNIEKKKKESEDIGFQRSVSFHFTHSDGNVDTVALYDEKSNVLKAP
jgi:hypothetical protein